MQRPEHQADHSVPEGPPPGRVVWRKIRDALGILLAAVAAALLLRTFVLEALHVPSHSMEPSLLAGDFVIVNKLPRIRVNRGEVFAFRVPGGVVPGRPERFFVKRCVAVPGDSVAVAEGLLWVNGVRSDPPGAVESAGAVPAGLAGIRRTWVIPRRGERIALHDSVLFLWHALIEREGHRVEAGLSGGVLLDGVPATSYRVEQNHYFMAGDNRAESYDSRFWGLLPERTVLGRVILIYWSWDDRRSAVRWGRVGTIVR